jgi:hypothetical protein
MLAAARLRRPASADFLISEFVSVGKIYTYVTSGGVFVNKYFEKQ